MSKNPLHYYIYDIKKMPEDEFNLIMQYSSKLNNPKKFKEYVCECKKGLLEFWYEKRKPAIKEIIDLAYEEIWYELKKYANIHEIENVILGTVDHINEGIIYEYGFTYFSTLFLWNYGKEIEELKKEIIFERGKEMNFYSKFQKLACLNKKISSKKENWEKTSSKIKMASYLPPLKIIW
ncbi:MAG: hypothetical protein QXP60_07055 [Nitrososphaerota archaeon]